jgi:maltodextrin utilization protein YvdJ
MEILFLVIFLGLLTILPIMAFFVVRRVFSIFRLIPHIMKEVVLPHLAHISEVAESDDGRRYTRVALSQEQIDLIRKSFLGKQIEVNPKRFSPKSKKTMAILGGIIGITILSVVVYKMFWVIYDFIVLTYF